MKIYLLVVKSTEPEASLRQTETRVYSSFNSARIGAQRLCEGYHEEGGDQAPMLTWADEQDAYGEAARVAYDRGLGDTYSIKEMQLDPVN